MSRDLRISAFCTVCDATTAHMIDWIGDEEWWVCSTCLEPSSPVKPRKVAQRCVIEPDYDPFYDDELDLEDHYPVFEEVDPSNFADDGDDGPIGGLPYDLSGGNC
ncbi:MAG TPA: hypothetical protein VHE55_05290 [Fimbriimonadaceae bacterium]|nr:hypothetical protein [Fimbriimonadaceae bacterium]